MPTNISAPRPAGVCRKFPSHRIVSLNLSKCVSQNLTDLWAKVDILKKEGSETVTRSQMKATAPRKISQMSGKKLKSLGKKFIKEFKYFSKSGVNRISYPQTLSWLKKAGILDNSRVTIRDVEVHFINKLKSGYDLRVLEFIRFVKSLCEDRGLEMPTVIFQLLNCRKQTKTVKKKKRASHVRFLNKKQETQHVSSKNASAIHTTVENSEADIPLDNTNEQDNAAIEGESTAVPKYLSKNANEIRHQTAMKNKHSKGDAFENIVSVKRTSISYPRKLSKVKTVGWLTPTFRSIPPPTRERSVKKSEVIRPERKFQNSGTQTFDLFEVRETKVETATLDNDANEIDDDDDDNESEKSLTRDTVGTLWGEIFEVQSAEECYEYIDSDEDWRGRPVPYSQYLKELYNVTKTDNGKVDLETVADTKLRSSDGEIRLMVSVKPFTITKDNKNNKRNFDNLRKVNETSTETKKTNLSTSSSGKNRKYAVKLGGSKDLAEKVDGNGKLETKNKDKGMSPSPEKLKLQSRLQESNVGQVQKGPGLGSNASSKVLPSTENKVGKLRSNRTFSNLPIKRVKKQLRQSTKQKMADPVSNNENSPPVQKAIVATNGRKKASTKTRSVSVSRKKISSKPIVAVPDPIRNEVQVSNTDADVSKCETKMAKRKITKSKKIRKGVCRKKKDLKGPETEIQTQEGTKT